MSDDDEIKDPQEALDEEEDEDELLDPEKLKNKGLHIEGEDDVIDPEIGVDPLLEKDPLLDDDGLPLDSEDEDEVDLEDDEFSDKADW